MYGPSFLASNDIPLNWFYLLALLLPLASFTLIKIQPTSWLRMTAGWLLLFFYDNHLICLVAHFVVFIS